MAKKIVKKSNNLFVADLGNVKLTPAQQQSIATGIQEVVMLELAQLDLGGLVTVKPPRKWELQGIVAVPVDKLNPVSIKNIEEQIGNNPFGG